ncbi:3-methyl-2-oxobutanoate hydroxymethyltransferase [Candidatus Viridilinea mediisalina]|uniref:3-methyl-2-oxobutanoate hydroxymethyltransferase n=1 Tax=Candidatus Viridilinea mediisalina TaxID=2024553 RepID=A0A2A6RFZ3_9CHLR|nr:3-methyl-2-oxobutanoate hydroxymethyltransferase [Candidatus Viridilinea mediisalina]PDW01851.1 3-methyl-2-oxobutanoate hydroxymethyltransferase [Candidatus Viridilinea mediisalina]
MRTTILEVQKLKNRGERIPMVTAYDYTSAQIADRAGIPLILVGDSLGMVVLGHTSTVPVTLDEMLHHMRAVVRGSQSALVVGDLPFLTYTTTEEAIQSARRAMQEAGVQAVKLEGGAAIAPSIARLVELGIPVMGHIGFTPQSVNQIGTRVQGRAAADAARLINDALAIEAAGAFGLVLELVPAPLASVITQRLRIPTIGIGAGAGCAGQVQVWHDLFGLYSDFLPRHARRYLNLSETITNALTTYANDVREGTFPTAEQSSTMDDATLQAALKLVEQS